MDLSSFQVRPDGTSGARSDALKPTARSVPRFMGCAPRRRSHSEQKNFCFEEGGFLGTRDAGHLSGVWRKIGVRAFGDGQESMPWLSGCRVSPETASASGIESWATMGCSFAAAVRSWGSRVVWWTLITPPIV